MRRLVPTMLATFHDLRTRRSPYWFSGFGQSTYDVTPDGRFAVMHFRLDDALGAMVVQNWPELIERAR